MDTLVSFENYMKDVIEVKLDIQHVKELYEDLMLELEQHAIKRSRKRHMLYKYIKDMLNTESSLVVYSDGFNSLEVAWVNLGKIDEKNIDSFTKIVSYPTCWIYDNENNGIAVEYECNILDCFYAMYEIYCARVTPDATNVE